MKLPTSDHPHRNLLAQHDFNVNDAADFITIKSGRDLETSAKYRQELLESFEGTLVPDIDTSVYKGVHINNEFVMKKYKGKLLVSKQSIEQWIVQNSIEIAEEFQVSPAEKKWSNNITLKSSYLTIDELQKLSRKASFNMEEIVRILHLRNFKKRYMSEDMLDTWDTINRRLAASGEAPKKDQQMRSADILTIAACLFYPIPCQLVKWLKLPIEGVNWTSKPLDTGEKIGEPEKRVRVLRDVVSEMLTKGIFSENQPRWPRTKIWEQAVNTNPDLFPDDRDDQKEGVFTKAYNQLKREF